MPAERPAPETTLDWEPKRAREWGERAVALWEEFLARLDDLPVGRRWPAGAVRDAVALPVPATPMSDDDVFAHLRDVVFANSVYPGSPRFMAYVSGPGTVPGAAADLIAAALNANLGGWRLSPAATEIELALMKWFASGFGLPESAAGLLTSGGAMANFTCLKVARDRIAGLGVRETGLGTPFAIYASDEVHAVTPRAADMLGLGTNAVRYVPTDDVYRMRVDDLRKAIDADRERGVVPGVVVASAGTVATGAVDPLNEIADLCAERGMWMHVDGAYGGPAVFAPDLRPSMAGIERADSIAFDPHKWLYTPHSGGCALFRDIGHAFDSFHSPATYTIEDVEESGATFDFGSHGPQWSRGFNALKIWLSLLAHGSDAYARRISHDAELARYLGARVSASDDLELVTPVSLSICCFRYVPPGFDGPDEYLDKLNARLMTAIQLDGRAYCSNAVLRGRFVLRACIVNFRTEAGDVDALLDVVRELGAKLHAKMSAAA